MKTVRYATLLVAILMAAALAAVPSCGGSGGGGGSGDDSSGDDSSGDDTSDDTGDDTGDDTAGDDTGGATFDLAFSGTGFTPHNGQMLHVAVLDAATDAHVVTDQSQTVSGGTFSFNFPGVLEQGHNYHVDYYADFNGNGSCDSPPTDHVWRAEVSDVQDNVNLQVTHNTNFTDVCSSF